MTECVFCRIASGDVPAKEVYRDDDAIAIEDLNPQAPVHLLVISVKHYPTIGEATGGDSSDAAISAALIRIASRLGEERGGRRGYRLVINTGIDGGQTVGHVHVHVLAGRTMGWPPG
ncbi:MAG: HIT domain-containing protein [Candidatus Eremiobacteraeota bacterium]|nr:HIT domain-containing protein [Candidatus Eremiobacteraeota bacterium]MBV9699622.1 HIT domain-containing protein [Candidatus Eremiobacteraeota bacterium]